MARGKTYNLAVKVDGDTKGAQKAFGDVRKSARKMGRGMQDIGKTLTLGVTLPLTLAAGAAVNLAAEANEVENKLRTVFGSQFNKVTSQLDSFAKSTGASRFQLREAAGDFGVMLKGMGLTEQATAGLSTKMAQLGKDVSSYNDLAETVATEKLLAGLSGEVEPLKKLGLAYTQAEVNLTKWGKAAKAQGREMTQAEKVNARYFLMMEKARKNGTLGDAAKTAESFSNRLKTLKNNIRDTATEIGFKLLPYADKLLTWAQKAVDAFGDLTPKQQKVALVLAAVAAAAGPVLFILGSLVVVIAALASPVGAVVVGITALIGVLGVAYAKNKKFRKDVNAVGRVVGKLAKVYLKAAIIQFKVMYRVIRTTIVVVNTVARVVGRVLVGAFKMAWSMIKNSPLGWLVGMLRRVVSGVVSGVSKLGSFKDAAVGAFRAARDWAQRVVDKIQEIIGKITGAIGKVGSLKGKLGGLKPWEGALPGFAVGGIIRSPMVAMVGEAGPEAVVPLGNSPADRRNRARVMNEAGLNSGGGGGSTVVNQTFVVQGEPNMFSLSRQAGAAMRRRLQGSVT